MSPAREERVIIALYILTDLLLVWMAYSLATASRVETLYQIDFLLLERDRWICLGIFISAAAAIGCYRTDVMLDSFDAVYYAAMALGIAAIIEFTLTALTPVEWRIISRTELALGTILSAALILFWHTLASVLIPRFPSMQRFFYVLGDAKEGHVVAKEIRDNGGTWLDAKYVDTEQLARRIEKREEKGEQAMRHEDAIVTMAGQNPRAITGLLELCETHCRRTYLYPTVDDMLLYQHQSLVSVAGLPLIQVASRAQFSPYFILKRAMDFSVALAVLTLCSPLFIFTALAVGLTSRGGVFYRQERLGRNGAPIHIYKFRSMVNTAPPKKGKHKRAERDDPRVTTVGRFIRKYKIDELPQVLNVLRGEMSLVGPRPLWDGFFEENGEHSDLWKQRLAVRPGLTSLLHVKGHSFAKPGDFLRYDLIYIKNISLMLDMKILLGTVRIVLSGRGS